MLVVSLNINLTPPRISIEEFSRSCCPVSMLKRELSGWLAKVEKRVHCRQFAQALDKRRHGK